MELVAVRDNAVVHEAQSSTALAAASAFNSDSTQVLSSSNLALSRACSDAYSATAPRKQQAPYPSVVAGPALIREHRLRPGRPRAPFAAAARLACGESRRSSAPNSLFDST